MSPDKDDWADWADEKTSSSRSEARRLMAGHHSGTGVKCGAWEPQWRCARVLRLRDLPWDADGKRPVVSVSFRTPDFGSFLLRNPLGERKRVCSDGPPRENV